MTTTNMCSNFIGFRSSPPLRFDASVSPGTHVEATETALPLAIEEILSFDEASCNDVQWLA